MSWNRVIDETKTEVSFRLGSKSHNKTNGIVIAVEIKMLLNDDGIPIMWTIDSKKIRSNGINSTGTKEILRSLDIL